MAAIDRSCPTFSDVSVQACIFSLLAGSRPRIGILAAEGGVTALQLSKIDQSGFAQAEKIGIGMVPAMADDNVVEHLDAHDLAGTDELFGDFDIFG